MIDQIAHWIEDYATRCAGRRTLVVGVSGGLDSAVVAKLCERTRLHTICVTMPASRNLSLPSFMRAAELIGGMQDCTHVHRSIIDILEAYETDLVEHTGDVDDDAMSCLRRGNLSARIRTDILYDVACARDGLVIGTCNLDELYTGYFTKGGDGMSDIEPLGELHKSQVRELASDLGVPTSIIEAVPTAELWEGQTDEGELGVTYDEIEFAIKKLCGTSDAAPTPRQRDAINIVTRLTNSTAHKRQLPPVFEV